MALVLATGAAASPAQATAWRKPLLVGDSGGGGVDIAGSGTIRVLKQHPKYRFEIATLRRGASKFGHCRIPGMTDATDTYAMQWVVNPSGAMALGYDEGLTPGRVYGTTAGAGRCFRKARVLSRKGPDAELGPVRIGDGGTALVGWSEDTRPFAYSTGAAGGSLGGARVPFEVPPGEQLRQVLPFFTAGDRVLWTWWTSEGGDGGTAGVQRLMATQPVAAGSRPGKARRVAAFFNDPDGVEHSFFDVAIVTARHGSQVAG